MSHEDSDIDIGVRKISAKRITTEFHNEGLVIFEYFAEYGFEFLEDALARVLAAFVGT